MESVLLIGLAALVLLGLVAMPREHFDPKLFDPLDTDKNDALSRAEFEAAKSAAEEDTKTADGEGVDGQTEDSGIDTPMEPRTEFDIGLDLYKKNMLAYKTTGDAGSKVAADEAKKWIEEYLKSVGDNINTDTNYIRQFVSDYKDTNPDLLKMQKTLKGVREKGPKLQDAYETEKKATYVEPYDVQEFYTKLGIFGAVLAIIVVVALF